MHHMLLRRLVTVALSVPYKYSYLLTYLLTYLLLKSDSSLLKAIYKCKFSHFIPVQPVNIFAAASLKLLPLSDKILQTG